MRDILAAMQQEKNATPDMKIWACARSVAEGVKKKFADANPELKLITDHSLVNKITKRF